MPDFTSMFIEYTIDFESPKSFWQWSSYATIAAILRNNIYYEYKLGRVYPNLFVLLLADSAAFRKSGPFKLVKDLINDVSNTKIFSGTASIQGILDKLSQDYPTKKGAPPLKGGSCLILAEELASFFVEDPRLMPLLTRMYDYEAKFDYELRGAGFIINNLCMTMLMASNETFLREVYTKRAVYGGLLRRTLLIKPNEKRKPNSLMNLNGTQKSYSDADRKPLTDHLIEISKLKGLVLMTSEASISYDTWYKDLYNKYEKYGNSTGVLEGMHTLVLKVAMCIAAGNLSLELTKDNIEEAIISVTDLRSNYEIYAMSSGKSKEADNGAALLTLLHDATENKLKSQEIMLKLWNDISSEDLDKLIQTLKRAGLVNEIFGTTDVSYQLTEKCLNMLEAKKGITP